MECGEDKKNLKEIFVCQNCKAIFRIGHVLVNLFLKGWYRSLKDENEQS